MASPLNLFGVLAECVKTSFSPALGVSPNFEITVACRLKFHWCLRTLSLKFQKARTTEKPTGQRRENFNFACSLLKF